MFSPAQPKSRVTGMSAVQRAEGKTDRSVYGGGEATHTPAPMHACLFLSCRFGRKALIVWCYLQMGVSGACTAFVPNFTAYCILRFLSGMAMSGISLNSVSLCK